MPPSWPRVSHRTEYTGLVVLAALLGVLGAAASAIFQQAIVGATAAFALVADLLGPVGSWSRRAAPPLVLMIGAGILLVLHRLAPGDALGYGFPRFLEMIHLEGGRLKKRWMIVKTIGAAVALGAGASVGREGPIAQIGGSVGYALAQLLKSGRDRTRLFVACGAASGVATTFNAPIAAVMFAQEIVLQGELELAHFSLIVIAAATGVITTRLLGGTEQIFGSQQFALVSVLELPGYAALGLLLGGLAVCYTRGLAYALAWGARSRLGTGTKLVAGLGIVGLVGMVLPQNLSDGYPTIRAALAGELPWALMAVLAAAKFGTSILSLSCGTPGGVFGPIFFIGATAGGAFRALATLVLPHTGPRGSYALIGLGAFLAACTHAPLTAIFLLFETTGNYAVALPALVTVILAVIVATTIEAESVDTLVLARAGKTLHPPRAQIMDLIPVATAFHPEFTPVPADAPLTTLLRIMGESSATSFPVLSADGRLMGTVSLHDVRPLLLDPTATAAVIAADLCDATVPTVTPETSLGKALGRMEAENREEIPVVDAVETWRVVGLLSRGDAIRAYNRALLSMQTLQEAGGAADVPRWSKGYRVTSFPVQRGWDGRSLRDLDLRARFGVSVLAVEPHDRPGRSFEVPDPDRTLRTGDGLVVAGPSDKVAAFERRPQEPEDDGESGA